jgi:hypothetical protein
VSRQPVQGAAKFERVTAFDRAGEQKTERDLRSPEEMLEVLRTENRDALLAEFVLDQMPIELFSHNAKYLQLTKVYLRKPVLSTAPKTVWRNLAVVRLKRGGKWVIIAADEE